MTIRNINDLAAHVGTTVDRLEHDLYKYTDCGAWITWNATSVTIGSIVEGSDAEFSLKFSYPFESDNYDEWLDRLEKLTNEVWHEANDDDPYDIVREMTDGDPLADLTESDAIRLIKEAEEKGYSVPASLTPELFLEIYNDLKPEEEK